MDLTLGIICSLLSGAYDVVANFPPDEDYLVSEWRIHNGEKPEPDVLYLVNEGGGLQLACVSPRRYFPKDVVTSMSAKSARRTGAVRT